MSTSILVRSAVAVAALAVGSAALVAAPANAAPSDITRAQVLDAVARVRAEPEAAPGAYSDGTARALRVLANRACLVDPDGTDVVMGVLASPTEVGRSADGLVALALVNSLETIDDITQARGCAFGAVAATAGSATLSGTATLGGSAPVTLAGDVTVTPATVVENGSPFPAFTASGASTITTTTTVTVKVAKTTKQKRAAKKAYDKALTTAKKSYSKALKKAGSSKSKKAAAKKTYAAKKSKAKAAYRSAIAAGHKVVETPNSVATPFTLSATFPPLK
jgi:hypothetical protein